MTAHKLAVQKFLDAFYSPLYVRARNGAHYDFIRRLPL